MQAFLKSAHPMEIPVIQRMKMSEWENVEELKYIEKDINLELQTEILFAQPVDIHRTGAKVSAGSGVCVCDLCLLFASMT